MPRDVCFRLSEAVCESICKSWLSMQSFGVDGKFGKRWMGFGCMGGRGPATAQSYIMDNQVCENIAHQVGENLGSEHWNGTWPLGRVKTGSRFSD